MLEFNIGAGVSVDCHHIVVNRAAGSSSIGMMRKNPK